MNGGAPPKKVWPTIALATLALVALLTCLVLGGFLYLPQLASRYLPVEQIRRLGFTDFSGRITRIGLHQAAAGPFVFGPVDRPAISIGSVEVDYTLAGLRRKKIDRLRIDDLTIHALLGPEGIVLPGWDRSRPAETTPAGPGPLLANQDGTIGEVQIRSARVILKWRDATSTIPFEADIRPQGDGSANLAAQIHLLPGDQKLSLNAELDLKKNKGELVLDGPDVHLDRFVHLFHELPGLELAGRLRLQARAGLQIDPLAISDAEFKAAWHGGRLEYGPLALAPEAQAGSVRLSAVSADLARWQVEAEGLQLQAPLPVTVDTVKAAIDLAADVRTLTGQTRLAVRPFAVRCPRSLVLEKDLALPLAFEIRSQAPGGWSAVCRTLQTNTSVSSDRLRLAVEGLHLQSGGPHIQLNANADGQGWQVHGQVDLPAVGLEASGVRLALPRAQGEGRIRFNPPDTEAEWSGDLQFRIPEATIAGRGLAGQLKELVASANLRRKTNQPPHVQGRLRLSDGRLTHGASGFDLSGLRLDLPYDSAAGANPGKGSFAADLGYHRHVLGQLQGRVTQQKGAFRIAASHTGPLFPGLTTTVTGSVRLTGAAFPEAVLHLDLPVYDLPDGYDLGRLIPALDGATLSGTMSAQATASITATGASGTSELAFHSGRFEIPEKQLTVEGIDTILRFPELPRVRSGPAQSIRFTRAAMGGIVVDGGQFDFQVESPRTLFVEKGRLAWCGGKIESQALRLTAGKQDYALTLYCQRLELSRILEQLGTVNARGGGTVNGRIPISYSNGAIRFDDGFLFSTPGEEGQIRLTGTEILTQGIPADTPQFAQVDLAREALKDYDYKWAKLGMTTEGESLVLRLQFDGQPAGPLPFVYKKEIGSFVRVEAGAQGSRFQGIALDVNLRLPLNRLLEYKEIVNMIE